MTTQEVTAREAEILELIARHLTNAQIADALVISPRTVESHVSALLRKLGLPDRRSLARHAEAAPGLRPPPGRRALPDPVTSFVGRAAERAALAAAVAEHRMVTATGPGGVGKTRLALTVAADVAAGRRDGVWFVDLVHVTDPALVTAAVAESVGAAEQHRGSAAEALLAVLAGRNTLLVLDNCEHVLDGVRDCVDGVLAGCPEVTVLATSRVRLLMPYESVYAVPGLAVDDAVALFGARGGDAVPADHDRVADLCRALDGMALAIELAAARFPALGLDGLEAGLEQRLRLLAAGTRAADRHRSLRDAIGWSYDLLAAPDRALLRGIAVFASWFDVDAALAVIGGERLAVVDGLARLNEHSLLAVERGEPTRYRALETIRQYGVERLADSGELAHVRARHERWCRTVLAGLGAADVGELDDAWCARFDRVVDDAGAVLAWVTGDEARQDDAAGLAAELAGLLFLRGRPAQAQRRYEQAAGLTAGAGRADHLRYAAGAAAGRFVGDDALRLYRAAAGVALAAGDRAGAGCDLATMAMYLARAPGIMRVRHPPREAASVLAEAAAAAGGSSRAAAAIAVAEGYADDMGATGPADARRAVELAAATGDGIVESIALDMLSAALVADRDIAGAVGVSRTRLDLLARLPIDARSAFEQGDGRLMAADVAIAAGDLAAAAAHADALERLPCYRDEDHLALCRRALVDAVAGRFDDAVGGGERFRAGWERAGRPVAPTLCRAAFAVAMVHGMRGDEQRRAEWVRLTADVGVDLGLLPGDRMHWPAVFDGLLDLHRDDPAAVLRRYAADLDDPTIAGTWDTELWRPWYAAVWAEAAVLAGHPDAAARVARARGDTRDNPIATAMVDRAAALASGDRAALAALAVTFVGLGSPYQQARTGLLLARLPDPAHPSRP